LIIVYLEAIDHGTASEHGALAPVRNMLQPAMI